MFNQVHRGYVIGVNVKRQAQLGGFLFPLINDCPVAKMYAVKETQANHARPQY